MMGFSVDYEFIQGQPQPSEQYFWVIERAQGTPAKIAKKLQSKGTLEGFLITGSCRSKARSGPTSRMPAAIRFPRPADLRAP